tara:strand:+ start:280 stop:465 length:186 start_codon:yes stop_codon:yes gene_type:complete
MSTFKKKPTMLIYDSRDNATKNDEQISSEVATCYLMLKQLKKEQKQRQQFNEKLELYKDFF